MIRDEEAKRKKGEVPEDSRYRKSNKKYNPKYQHLDLDKVEVDASSQNRILPHEFLFLLCNAKSRLETMSKIKHPKINPNTIASTNLCQAYELQDPAHKMNRNRIFNLDKIKNFNPRDNIYQVLDDECHAAQAKVNLIGMDKTIGNNELENLVNAQMKKDKAVA